MKIIGKIESINQGAHFCNVTINDEHRKAINIKLEPEDVPNLTIGKAYLFNVVEKMKEEKEILEYVSSSLIEESLSKEELDHYVPIFYSYAPVSIVELREGIESFLNQIENSTIKTITEELYKKYENSFYVHSAATKFHHAYVGGLAYHTLTMLKLSTTFVDVYPYLNKDLIYGGIILHDMAKISEITGSDGEYTKEGLLIGHLVMIAIEIEKIAVLHNLQDTEEVLLLKHIVLSHHGQLNFGSPKKPQIGEALLIWFLDTIDSKFTPLKEAFDETTTGTFTNMLPVLDRMRFYKDELKK